VFDVGDTLGDYELVSRLTQGGMAALFLGQRRNAPPGTRPVAIKVIHESLSDDWQFVRMFIDEALISVRIRHPNVIRVEELGEKDERYYLVMEYVHGCSLAELLRALAKQGRRMRPEIAVWIASRVAAGLHAAHEMTGEDGSLLNVIHRDVSPQNVLLSSDGDVKLLDFGIAKAAGRAERTEAGVIKGKVRYMAPEQAKGDPLDRRVDVYALAIVVWEMLTMRRFIKGRSEIEIIRKVRNPKPVAPSERGKGITPEIDDAVLSGLVVDREARAPSAAIFQQNLEAAIEGRGIGPSHVAELLRVFVGEHLEETARSLPSAIGAELLRSSTDVNALPGDAPNMVAHTSDQARTRTLTIELPTEAEPEPPQETRSLRRPAERKTPVPPPAPQLAAEISAMLPSFGDVADDEHTLEASGPELKQFLDRIRMDMGVGKSPPKKPGGFAAVELPEPKASRPRPAPPSPPPRPSPPPSPPAAPPAAPAPIEAPAPDTLPSTPSPTYREPEPTPQPMPLAPAPEEKTGVGPAGWALRVALITIVAFAVGAALAVVAVKFVL